LRIITSGAEETDRRIRCRRRFDARSPETTFMGDLDADNGRFGIHDMKSGSTIQKLTPNGPMLSLTFRFQAPRLARIIGGLFQEYRNRGAATGEFGAFRVTRKARGDREAPVTR
jgi:hypothetical protein